MKVKTLEVKRDLTENLISSMSSLEEKVAAIERLKKSNKEKEEELKTKYDPYINIEAVNEPDRADIAIGNILVILSLIAAAVWSIIAYYEIKTYSAENVYIKVAVAFMFIVLFLYCCVISIKFRVDYKKNSKRYSEYLSKKNRISEYKYKYNADIKRMKEDFSKKLSKLESEVEDLRKTSDELMDKLTVDSMSEAITLKSTLDSLISAKNEKLTWQQIIDKVKNC